MFQMAEVKTKRVQVLFPPSELAVLDEWCFNNRIRSRGEAIRDLIRASIEMKLISEWRYKQQIA
jgi:metal-responsive CopG/Arc/MetJ family transcriptional regulator